VLTYVLEEFSSVLELDVEVPASTEGTHWGLLPMALPADHADLGTITTIGERTGYAKNTSGQLHRQRETLPNSHLLLRFQLLVRRFYHLVLLRQVYPKLKAARFGLARFFDGHFGMDD
jgi:hypothetical protein